MVAPRATALMCAAVDDVCAWSVLAAALGALLNTRGLVELIVLNIADNAHVFSPTPFTNLVVMALLTPMITTPILDLLGVEDGGKETEDLAVIKAA